jgi:hypothetical protein
MEDRLLQQAQQRGQEQQHWQQQLEVALGHAHARVRPDVRFLGCCLRCSCVAACVEAFKCYQTLSYNDCLTVAAKMCAAFYQHVCLEGRTP